MTAEAVDLAGGPKGYVHGFVCVDPAKCGHASHVSARTHTGRLAARDVRAQRGRLRNASPALTADRATAALRGKKGSDYQHRAAARLHAAAARSASSPAMRARHQKLAAMHRGIAARTPGYATRGERKAPAARPAPQYSSPIGPNMGEVGKAARGRKGNLPRGKASETASGRAAAYRAGHAIPPPRPGAPPGFPITSPKSWEKARGAIGRVKNPQRRAAVAALLRRTAAQYGKTAALKKSWVPTSNTRPGLELAMASPALAITGPYDIMITRADDGSAMVRHRRGGGEIGRISRGADGSWRAERGGRGLTPHTRQRGALLELIGTHNRDAGTPFHRPSHSQPLQPPPVQTPLMRAAGCRRSAPSRSR